MISKYFNDMFLKIRSLIGKSFEPEIANVILGITLGYTSEIDEDIKSDFSDSNIAHILAVSGMHVGYLVLFCKIIFEKFAGKKKSNIFSMVIIVFYMFLTGGSSSVVRASFMTVSLLLSKLIHRKSDVWTNLSLSILIILVVNPFEIRNSGLILSYMATIGIIIGLKTFKTKDNSIEKVKFSSSIKWSFQKILELIKITFFASVFIAPIIAIYFNKVSILSLFISAFVGILVAPAIILIFLLILNNSIGSLRLIIDFSIFEIIHKYLGNVIKIILEIIIKALINVAKFGANLPLGKILVITPTIVEVIFYYIFLFIMIFVYTQKNKKTAFGKRIKNLVSLFKFRLNQNKNKVISIILISLIIFSLIKIIPKELRIYFIDVGQGDATLIITPSNKNILIDGGGSENYDVGENTLLPYLLDRRIKNIDYAIISHFDTDHVGGILTLMQNIVVKNVVISKQIETTENLEKFYSIAKTKKINIKIVEAGDILSVEKNIYFNIFWPVNKNMISENGINNNSIVCKLHYNDFSMLFTGDIEKIAEKEIAKMYQNADVLNSNILKIAHHGSKSSSIQEFMDLVKPNIAVIGVGRNNKYGHPNEEVLKRLVGLRHKDF